MYFSNCSFPFVSVLLFNLDLQVHLLQTLSRTSRIISTLSRRPYRLKLFRCLSRAQSVYSYIYMCAQTRAHARIKHIIVFLHERAGKLRLSEFYSRLTRILVISQWKLLARSRVSREIWPIRPNFPSAWRIFQQSVYLSFPKSNINNAHIEIKTSI